jgi:hypothetical protein
MGKSSPSPPAAPDPVATANAQAAANKESAIATSQINQVNQVTPYGNLEYTQRGTTAEGVPQYTATQTLAPDQQRMLDLTNQAGVQYGETANAQLGNVRDKLSQPLDFSTLGAAPQVNDQTRSQVAQSMYDRLNPQLDRDRNALEARLASQGIGIGTQAYQAAMDDQNRARNDARLAIDAQAGNQMAQEYGLASTARNSAVNEQVMQRQVPLNELAAMLSGSQVQGPQFVNPGQTQIAPADIMGATYANYNGALNAYNQGVGSNNAMMGGLFGLGAAGLGAGMSKGGFLTSML